MAVTTPSRRLFAALLWRLGAANTLAGVIVVTYFTLVADVPDDVSTPENVVGNAASFAVLSILFGAFGFVRARRRFLPTYRFLDEERPPNAAERRDLVQQPLRIGLFPLRYWVPAAGFAAATQVVSDASPRRTAFLFLATLQGGFVAAAISARLSQRVLRPLIALALAGRAAEQPTGLGIGPRLMLAWALGSGSPLVAIALTPIVAGTDADLPVTIPMVFLAVIGFAIGLILLTTTAHAIAEPIDQVRGAMARVEEGDLDASVVVDDGGQLGLLQAGFNDMVAGLRDRERVAEMFGRHVGTDVARLALAGPVELGGELRSVTSFFVDIIGSTAMARQRAPSEVVALLNEFFAVVVGVVEAEGGLVNKFEGDGALCIFGAPVALGDHASRGLRAARELDSALRELAGLAAGIGVSTGDAVAGNVGAAHRLEYTVIGTPVNEAARLSDAAKLRPSRVLASAAAVAAADAAEARHWVPAGCETLKGLGEDFPVFAPRR